MKGKWSLSVFLIGLLVVLFFVGIHVYLYGNGSSGEAVDIFVGVDAAYDSVTDLKSLIDEVKSYTNFFAIGSTAITLNETKLNDLCQYLNASGLNFATYTHTVQNTTSQFNQSAWTAYAKQKWGSEFLGLYAYDEPGGHQIDKDNPYMVVTQAGNYSDAASKYVKNLRGYISEFIALNTTLITTDYVLYEFDYRAGYDIVLAEYAWNHSRSINTALCRGSATVHDKDWGVMITYTYTQPPYLESGPQIYNDLVTAYQNGAKYFLVFDYAFDPVTKVYHGILQQEHLDALKQFWQYVKDHPRNIIPVSNRVAYVLPADYGYGFRGPNDSLWGLFGADNMSSKIWNDAITFANQYAPNLDIIYADSLNNYVWNYSKLIFWNGTVLTKSNPTK